MATRAQQMLTAVLSGDVEVVAALLEDDPQLADLADRTPDRLSVLHHAARRGDLAIVELLLAAGASVNKGSHDGSTPLHLAALGGHLEIARAMIIAGADTRATTNVGYSALDAAKVGGNHVLVEVLAELPRAGIDRHTFRGKREWS